MRAAHPLAFYRKELEPRIQVVSAGKVEPHAMLRSGNCVKFDHIGIFYIFTLV